MSHAARRAVSGVFFVNGAALGGWVPHIADVKRNLDLPNHVVGAALLSSAVGAVTAMQASGFLIHRFGSRGVTFTFGLVLLAVVPLLLAAPTLGAFVAALALVGASNGLMDVSMNAHAVVVQGMFQRPILSAVHGWFSVGGFAGALGAAIAARLGVTPLQHLVLASGVLAVVLFVVRGQMLPSEVDKDAEGSRFVLPSGRLLWIGLLVCASFIAEGVMWDWSAVYLRTVLGATAAIGALGFGIAAFSMGVGRFTGDEAIHRFGQRPVFLLSAVFSGVGFLIAVATPSVAVSIVGFSMAGLGLANLVPVLFRAAGSMPGISTGTGIAAAATCGYAGFLGGPPAVGMLADVRSLGFAIGCAAGLCGLIALGVRGFRDPSDQS